MYMGVRVLGCEGARVLGGCWVGVRGGVRV